MIILAIETFFNPFFLALSRSPLAFYCNSIMDFLCSLRARERKRNEEAVVNGLESVAIKGKKASAKEDSVVRARKDPRGDKIAKWI
jgi:hypothetical protein